MEFIENDFPNLADQIRYLNEDFGWDGVIDALEFIQRHRETHYSGTVVEREFNRFVAAMRQMLGAA
jgi:hypothetical protein